jgi:hypothetical protein
MFSSWLQRALLTQGEPSLPSLFPVLGGRLEVDEESLEVRYRHGGARAPVLPVHLAASMVRSLSSLAVYASSRHAGAGDWLIIDEPEMNAHPKAQLRIVEFLAALAHKHGVHVLFTTHSPYMVDHVSNLLAAGLKSEPQQEALAPEFAYGRDSFLRPDEVAAYEFVERGDDVEVEPILNAEGWISNETFGAQSDRVANLYSKIVAQR